jgi:serine/threonine protein kinase
VWKAWDQRLERYVALKLLRRLSPEEVSYFVREAKISAGLSHPGIAAVYEAGEHEGRHFIAMQLVRGETLRQRIGGEIRSSVELLRDAAEAVHFAHEQEVVHRDLKPANLMVEERDKVDHVYVMDFGLARRTLAPPGPSLGAIVGTLEYMPPEQARGRPVDARSDVYSLGATLYHLLTGRPYITISDAQDIYAAIKAVVETCGPAPGDMNRGVDRALEEIVLRSLQKDPEHRFPTARELAEELGRWLDAGRPRVQQSPPASAPIEPLAPGKPFGPRYVLRLTVGAGRFAEIWQAWDGSVARWVALKIIRNDLDGRSSAAGHPRLHREIEVLAEADHPNVISLFDAGEIDGLRYVARRFVDGGRIDRVELDLRTKVRLVRDAALGVQHVNDLGFYRLDVKPGNLLVAAPPGAEPRVYVIDFDTALHAGDDDSAQSEIVGTAAFMSAEALGGGRCDRRADVYSLGVTLYTLLAGRTPFESTGSDFSVLRQKVDQGEWTPVHKAAPSVDSRLAAIVTKCMQRDPGQRYQTALELAEALDGYLGSRASQDLARLFAPHRRDDTLDRASREAPSTVRDPNPPV